MIDYPYDWELRDKIRLAKTLFYINGNEEYNFRQFLEAELSKLDRANRKEIYRSSFHQRQGACQVIEALLVMMQDADKVHDSLKRQYE